MTDYSDTSCYDTTFLVFLDSLKCRLKNIWLFLAKYGCSVHTLRAAIGQDFGRTELKTTPNLSYGDFNNEVTTISFCSSVKRWLRQILLYEYIKLYILAIFFFTVIR